MKWKRGCRLCWLLLPLVLLDRITKQLAVATLAPDGVRTGIPGVLSWAYTENTGTAFSLNAGVPAWVLSALTAAMLVALLVFQLARPDNATTERVGLWCIIGGGLSNLWDRLTRGSVIDFIRLDFVNFAVFNPADCFVCVGAALVVLSLFPHERRKSDG